MPHYKDGTSVKVGDQVLIPAVVVTVHEGTDYCNATLETERPMFPEDNKTWINLNTGQFDKKLE